MSNATRIVNPLTNPNGYIAAAGAVLAAAVMIDNAIHHHGILDTTVIVSAVGAVGALFSRQLVTPVRSPQDSAGNPLVPATPAGVPAAPAAPVAPPVVPVQPGSASQSPGDDNGIQITPGGAL